MTSQQTGGLKPSRRTLVKGAAWSVPVVAVAGAAPAFATSPLPIDFIAGQGCKDASGSGGARYYMWLTVNDPSLAGATISFTHAWTGSNNISHTGQQPGPFVANSISIGDPVQSPILIKFTADSGSANGVVTLNYTIGDRQYQAVYDGNQFSSDCQNRTPPITPFGGTTSVGASEAQETDATQGSKNDVEQPVVETDTAPAAPADSAPADVQAPAAPAEAPASVDAPAEAEAPAADENNG